MTIRPKFVTNSSSTSFFGYGAAFEGYEEQEKASRHIIDAVGLDLFRRHGYHKVPEDEEEAIDYLINKWGLGEMLYYLSNNLKKYSELMYEVDPYDGEVYAYVTPDLDDTKCELRITNVDKMRSSIALIKGMAVAAGGTGDLGILEGCWRDG